jgi:hypothetical protein
MWRRVDIVLNDVSEEHIASIFRVEEKGRKSTSEELAFAGDNRLMSRIKREERGATWEIRSEERGRVWGGEPAGVEYCVGVGGGEKGKVNWRALTLRLWGCFASRAWTSVALWIWCHVPEVS